MDIGSTPGIAGAEANAFEVLGNVLTVVLSRRLTNAYL